MSRAWQVAAVLASLAAAAGVSAGIVLRRPPNRRAWWLLASGLAVLALGDLVALAGSSPADGTDGAGPPHAAYLTAYLLVVVALFGLRPRGDRAGDRAALVDAAGIATSLTLLAWVFLIGSATGTGSTLDHAVTVASLLLDGVLLCVALRLVVTGPARPVPTLLALGAGALLVTDLVHAGEPGSRADLTDPAHLGWLVAAVLFAAAALHPAAAESFAPTAERPEKPSVRRLALLAGLVLLPPALIALQAARGEDDDLGVLSAGLGLLMVLVLVRAGLLVRDLAATAARERALRTVAAELVAAGDRSGIHAAALRAVERLVGQGFVAGRIVDVTALDGVEVVAGGGRHDARVRGRALAGNLLPYAGVATASPDVASLDLDVLAGLDLRDAEGVLRVMPVRVSRELLAVVVVVTDARLGSGTVDALETLTAQLALALESATLADDLHARKSEARFRALVQNSSDAILLLDREAVVTYQSPSSERMFGYPAGALVGRSVEDLCHPDDLLRAQSGLLDVLASPGVSRRLELRLRRRAGGWLDAEAVVNNLQSDPNVRATVVTVRDVSERKQFEMQLTHQAFHDELTGLANRALFIDRVAHALGRRERDGTTLAVLLLDLDDFKTVNDGLGHAAGDSMLTAVAGRLATLVRPGDTTARLGGDEFAMALVDLPHEEAAINAVERIISVLAQPLDIEGKEVFVQASIGLAFAGEGPVTPEEVLRNADAAMYVVKTDGKGRYAIFQPHMHAAALHRLDLRADLQRALDHDEFALHYQPIVSMATGSVVGRRGAGALAAPAARAGAAGRVHPPRRGDRARRAARVLGAGTSLPAGRRVVAREPRAVREHQRVPAPAAPRGVRRRGRPGPREHRHRPVADRAGDHRERHHGRRRDHDRAAPRAQDARRPAGRRRLRDGLLVVQLAAPAPGRRAQDRQGVRRRARPTRGGRLPGRGDHRPRAQPRAAHRGRGHRAADPAGPAPGHALRPRAGVPRREADASRGGGRPARPGTVPDGRRGRRRARRRRHRVGRLGRVLDPGPRGRRSPAPGTNGPDRSVPVARP